MEVDEPLKRNRKEMNKDYLQKKPFPNTFSKETNAHDEEVESKSGIYHQFPGGKGYYRNTKPLVAPLRGFRHETEEGDEEDSRKVEYSNHFKTASQQLVS